MDVIFRHIRDAGDMASPGLKMNDPPGYVTMTANENAVLNAPMTLLPEQKINECREAKR